MRQHAVIISRVKAGLPIDGNEEEWLTRWLCSKKKAQDRAINISIGIAFLMFIVTVIEYFYW